MSEQPAPGGGQRGQEPGQETEGRSVPEWISFAISALLVLGLVGVLVSDMVGADKPAMPVARVGEAIEQRGPAHHVPVRVRNEGDTTAADVQVVAELEVDGITYEGEKTIDFLAGGGEATVLFLFPRNPDNGELSVAVRSFAKP